ncbi:MAG TPA: hypothetical protein VGR26_18790 [Acidimicrobiales bacterium]|nr:hypothetical protein [Acidimicrobiales bacterium]
MVLLQAMNAEERRHVPHGAPIEFIPARWRPHLDAARAAGDENRFRHYWELCIILPLRTGLRWGEIWVQGFLGGTPTPRLTYCFGGMAGPAPRGAGAHGHAEHHCRAAGLDRLD